MLDNKIKKALLVLGLGFGMSLPSASIAAPNGGECATLEARCELGDRSACSEYDRFCW